MVKNRVRYKNFELTFLPNNSIWGPKPEFRKIHIKQLYSTMQVKFKKLHPNAVLPSYAHPGEDAGLDLVCTEIYETSDYIGYKTGIAVEIPRGYYGDLRPRSSNSKKDLILTNGIGTVDSGYRGELELRYKKLVNGYGGEHWHYQVYGIGDKIGQLLIMPYPIIEPIEVEELEDSIRGIKGYGSSGK